MYGYKVLSAAIYDPKKPSEVELVQQSHVDISIPVDFRRRQKLRRLFSLPRPPTGHHMPRRVQHRTFRELIPHVPLPSNANRHLTRMGNQQSGNAQALFAYDSSITPQFTVVENAGKASIKKITQRVGFRSL